MLEAGQKLWYAKNTGIKKGDHMQNYDVIIIGAGPGGIFCAYELMDKKKD